MKTAMLATALAFTATAVFAAPVTYQIDPDHTYPSFETDHMGGLSTWRGKITKTSGTIVLDKEAGTGTVDITMDPAFIEFGHQKMNDHAKSPDMFDVAKYPTATYKGKLAGFKDGMPTEVQGELTLHGVTKPVNLKINEFMCKMHPMRQKEVCGADASGTFNRADFGVDYGKNFGFKMDVDLAIQVEALKAD